MNPGRHALAQGRAVQVDEMDLAVRPEEGGQVEVVAVPGPQDAEAAPAARRAGPEQSRDPRAMAGELLPPAEALLVERLLSPDEIAHDGLKRPATTPECGASPPGSVGPGRPPAPAGG